MIFKISTGDTNKISHRSNVHPDDPSSANLKAYIPNIPTIVKSLHSSNEDSIFDVPSRNDEEDEALLQLTPRK